DEILLLSEVLDLKANPKRFPIGTVIESRVDKRIGTLTTIIVQNGTLYKGDFLLVGSQYSKIRTLSDENGNVMDSIEPGCPAVVTGFKIPPTAGFKFVGINDEKFAK
ncbi:translation initiation factor IF-2, partial [Mycoplasmopsis synoviae]